MCLKWGTKYGPEYVNNLYAGVKRNLTVPFNFICITDDAQGLHPDIKTYPLIDPNLLGWWGKVSYFKTPMHDIEGICLTLDLDVVIIDNIDCFFEIDGDFCIEKDFVEKNGNNSSIMRFIANDHSDIYDQLNLDDMDHCTNNTPEAGWRKCDYWGDQVWITEKRPNAVLWPKDWVKSYKWECLDEFGRLNLHSACKIILFHGKPNPHEALHNIQRWWNATGLN